jgi:hypothetical protein
MRMPTPPSFSPLTITLDTVPLSDMLGTSTAPDVSYPWVQRDYAPVLNLNEAKGRFRSAHGPASGGSDVLGLEEALSWKPAPVKPLVEPLTSSDRGQREFGKRDLGRNVATVQDEKRGFGSSSSSQLHPNTLPTLNKPAFGPTTPMPPDTPVLHPTQSVPPPLQIPPKSVFEPPTPASTDTSKRGTIPPFNNSVLRPPTSMPLDMLPIFPPAPTSLPPRPKQAPLVVRNPNTPPAPEYRAPSPPSVAPYQDLRNDMKMTLHSPWASSPSNLASLDPVAGGNHPPIAPPPHSVPQEQMIYHPRSTSLPRNQLWTSSPQGQSKGIVANGRARPSPPNGPGMDQTREGVTRSYYENVSSENPPFSPASGKEKKKPGFTGIMGALLKAKKFNKKAKAAKYGLASVEEYGSQRGTNERGHAEQEYKQNAPITAKSALSPKQSTGQAYISPPPVPQKLPPSFSDFSSQFLLGQDPSSTSRDVQQIGGDGWVSREQRVQPAATGTGIFATDDIRDQPLSRHEMKAANQSPPRMQVSEDTPSSSSHRPVITAPPPLVYYPSVPIATHVTCISTRLEAERDNATSGGDPIPSLNTISIPHIISSLSHLNERIGEACAILTKVIVSSRIATGESSASSVGVDTRRLSAKVERDMRTRVCEFLTEGIFGRFSVALGSEEDRRSGKPMGRFLYDVGFSFSISP